MIRDFVASDWGLWALVVFNVVAWSFLIATDLGIIGKGGRKWPGE